MQTKLVFCTWGKPGISSREPHLLQTLPKLLITRLSRDHRLHQGRRYEVQQILCLPTSMEGTFSSSPYQPGAWLCDFIWPMECGEIWLGRGFKCTLVIWPVLLPWPWGDSAPGSCCYFRLGFRIEETESRLEPKPRQATADSLAKEREMTVVFSHWDVEVICWYSTIWLISQIIIPFSNFYQFLTFNLFYIQGQLIVWVISAVTNGLTLGLLLYGYHFEINNFWTPGPHFHFSLDSIKLCSCSHIWFRYFNGNLAEGNNLIWKHNLASALWYDTSIFSLSHTHTYTHRELALLA